MLVPMASNLRPNGYSNRRPVCLFVQQSHPREHIVEQIAMIPIEGRRETCRGGLLISIETEHEGVVLLWNYNVGFTENTQTRESAESIRSMSFDIRSRGDSTFKCLAYGHKYTLANMATVPTHILRAIQAGW